jgi:hypothetical protein
MDQKRFLFVMGDGGGNVPPQLGLARALVSRGHDVRVLTEPCVEKDVRATGASYVSFTKAPHRSDRSRESDFVRDFDAKTPIGTPAAFRDRVIFGPARALAEDTMTEIERWQPHVLAPDWIRTGAAVAGEAAGVPTPCSCTATISCRNRESPRRGSGSSLRSPLWVGRGIACSGGSSCDCSIKACQL